MAEHSVGLTRPRYFYHAELLVSSERIRALDELLAGIDVAGNVTPNGWTGAQLINGIAIRAQQLLEQDRVLVGWRPASDLSDAQGISFEVACDFPDEPVDIGVADRIRQAIATAEREIVGKLESLRTVQSRPKSDGITTERGKRMDDTTGDNGYDGRVRASFARQRVMETIGAALTRVEPGSVEITLPFRADLTQQHGFVHAGIVATILDSACGYAAFSMMPPDVAVLTAEYKINLLRPAKGDRLVARARVIKAGKTLTVCSGDVVGQTGGTEQVVATMLATVMAVPQRDDLQQ